MRKLLRDLGRDWESLVVLFWCCGLSGSLFAAPPAAQAGQASIQRQRDQRSWPWDGADAVRQCLGVRQFSAAFRDSRRIKSARGLRLPPHSKSSGSNPSHRQLADALAEFRRERLDSPEPARICRRFSPPRLSPAGKGGSAPGRVTPLTDSPGRPHAPLSSPFRLWPNRSPRRF
jgi:hypothetical protein